MKEMTKSVPIRFDAQLLRRMSAAARRLGVSRAAVVRMSILAQLPKLEAGAIQIPITDPPPAAAGTCRKIKNQRRAKAAIKMQEEAAFHVPTAKTTTTIPPGNCSLWSSNGFLYYLTPQHPNGQLLSTP